MLYLYYGFENCTSVHKIIQNKVYTFKSWISIFLTDTSYTLALDMYADKVSILSFS